MIKRQLYEEVRKENIAKTVRLLPTSLMKPYSLLVQYYLRGRRRYTRPPSIIPRLPAHSPPMTTLKPLAERMRPTSLEHYFGQSHLVGPRVSYAL